MCEIQLKPVDQSIQQVLPPEYKFESMFTVDDQSYTVIVCLVDMKDVISGINLNLYRESGTLIKYSEEQFSPCFIRTSELHSTCNAFLL